MQTAIDDQVDIQPVLLTYQDSQYPSQSVPYLEQQSLLSCLWAILQEKEIIAKLFILPQISTRNSDRKALAFAVQEGLSIKLQNELVRG